MLGSARARAWFGKAVKVWLFVGRATKVFPMLHGEEKGNSFPSSEARLGIGGKTAITQHRSTVFLAPRRVPTSGIFRGPF
jgi:hypothetical protein